MQRLDDVTGDPIRISATQRERQRVDMVDQINQLILAHNELAREARRVRERLAALEAPKPSPWARLKSRFQRRVAEQDAV